MGKSTRRGLRSFGGVWRVFSCDAALSLRLIWPSPFAWFNRRNKMKSLLVTAVITTFVLALFLHSGNALVCYNCDVANCDKNITCTGDHDTCLIVYHGGKNSSRCWKYSDCNVDFISNTFGTKNFRYRCCQWNLCNNAPNVVTSKIVLSGAFLLTVVHMLKSLV